MAVADLTRCVHRVPGQDNLRKRSRARFWFYSGFTIIELLVVIAIIAILASILFPIFISAQENGRRAKCLSNLKQLSTAWLAYADDNGGRACPAFYYSEDGTRMYSWDFTGDYSTTPTTYRLGLLGPYTKSGAINSCPSFKSDGWGRPYTGYAYNSSYIGGDPSNEPPCLVEPCALGVIVRPSATVVFADGGYGRDPVKAQNYLRAPSDRSKFSAGAAHFRHNGAACVAYADGHVAAKTTKYLCDGRRAPECGALSEDDSAYDLK